MDSQAPPISRTAQEPEADSCPTALPSTVLWPWGLTASAWTSTREGQGQTQLQGQDSPITPRPLACQPEILHIPLITSRVSDGSRGTLKYNKAMIIGASREESQNATLLVFGVFRASDSLSKLIFMEAGMPFICICRLLLISCRIKKFWGVFNCCTYSKLV